MRLKNATYLMLLLLHGVLWTSCSGCLDDFGTDYSTLKIDSASGVVYNHFIALPDRGWDKSDSAVFELPLFERDADLNVTISVRHTNRYPYQNLQLTAFLAELDTSNIINSLPIRKNDDRIDSLIHRQDSLNQEKAQTEQKISAQKSQKDSVSKASADTLPSKGEGKEASIDSTHLNKLTPSSLTGSELAEKTMKEGDADTRINKSSQSDKRVTKDTEKSDDSHSTARKTSKSKIQPDKAASDSLTHIIEFRLFNDDDRKNGSGMMFVETDVTCGTIHLKANTRYKIFITHNMKENRLKGISDIGIELTGCKKQPIDKMSTKWWSDRKKEN